MFVQAEAEQWIKTEVPKLLHKNIKQHNYFFFITDEKWSLNTNQHIRMISEGSCDTENYSNGCWK